MAKDAKGHGSNKRGANTLDSVYSSKAGVGGHGPGMYARTASGAQYKLNPAATDGRIPRVGSDIDPSQHTAATDKAVAKSLAGGHPKSGTPPVHSGAAGRSATPKADEFYRNLERKQRNSRPHDDPGNFPGYRHGRKMPTDL